MAPPRPRRISRADHVALPRCRDSTGQDPHHAELESRPPRCVWHWEQWHLHRDRVRQQRADDRDEEDYDPGDRPVELRGHLLLDRPDVEVLMRQVDALQGKALRMYEAGEAEAWDEELVLARDMRAIVVSLTTWFEDELGARRIVDRANQA